MRSSVTSCAVLKHGLSQPNSCSLRNLVDTKAGGFSFPASFSFSLNEVNKTTMIDESRFPEDVLREADEETEVNEEPLNEFDGLDLRQAQCFGYGCPRASSWTNLAEIALDKGWNNINID